MEFVIEKDIPAPKRDNRGRPSIYAFGDMQIGDSVFFPEAVCKGKQHAAAIKYGQRHDMKFSARTIDNGLRIWRIA